MFIMMQDDDFKRKPTNIILPIKKKARNAHLYINSPLLSYKWYITMKSASFVHFDGIDLILENWSPAIICKSYDCFCSLFISFGHSSVYRKKLVIYHYVNVN